MDGNRVDGGSGGDDKGEVRSQNRTVLGQAEYLVLEGRGTELLPLLSTGMKRQRRDDEETEEEIGHPTRSEGPMRRC
jgi:hypothetical protein